MQPKADNDNDQRPAEFDRHLVASIPHLRRWVGLYVQPEAGEEIIQDTLTAAVAKWRNFRNPDGDYRNFKTWLQWQLRLTARNMRDITAAKKRHAATVGYDDVAYSLSDLPRQENITYANQIMVCLPLTREGQMLADVVGGESRQEVGERHGISSQRVCQLIKKARKRLVKRMDA